MGGLGRGRYFRDEESVSGPAQESLHCRTNATHYSMLEVCKCLPIIIVSAANCSSFSLQGIDIGTKSPFFNWLGIGYPSCPGLFVNFVRNQVLRRCFYKVSVFSYDFRRTKTKCLECFWKAKILSFGITPSPSTVG